MTFQTAGNAGHPRSPVSSILRADLSTLIVTVWHRGKSKIKRLLGNASPKSCTTHESTCRVPYEIVEMIIAHLAHDLGALKACSLTCRSWNTVVVPLLHHIFTLVWQGPDVITKPESLSQLHQEGLLDLVTTIRVYSGSFVGGGLWSAPQAFNHEGLRAFSAFTNIRTLELLHIAMGPFVPGVELYFGHLSQTLQSITLIDSHCHPLQLSHFLSLFPNLDDVEIRSRPRWGGGTTTPNTELVPFSTPKLRGRLVLHGFDFPETWTDLIAFSGGPRFRYMDLFRSEKCTSTLLGACAETLETLRFRTEDAPADGSALFDLSGLKVLRALQVEGWLVNLWLGYRYYDHTIIKEVFSTITSSVFSELVVVLGDGLTSHLSEHLMSFETLRSMSEVRPFKLVFLFEVPYFVRRGRGSVSAEERSEMKKRIESMVAKGFFDFLDSPPTICTAT